MNVDDFHYDLPEDLIATDPAPSREQSRLMVLPPEAGSTPLHRHFNQLPEFLQPGDLLVVNDSRVIPARLIGRRTTGGGVEVLLLSREKNSPTMWSALVRPGKKIREGEVVSLGLDGSMQAEVGERLGEGARRVRFLCDPDAFHALLQTHGQLPLPPYIVKKRVSLGGTEASYKPEDRERYQTVYAREEGSVAAPTAGLHFTPELLKRLEEMGVHTARVTLHVGAGTFQTMEPGGEVASHRMHFEEYEVPTETVAAIKRTRQQGHRVIAVGTTSVRTLEATAQTNGDVTPGKGTTDLLIAPGYKFRLIDGLITNFHLPRSTLLLLVSAMVGRERLLAAYHEAIREQYRFFSYGDAMFLTTLPESKHPSTPKP